MVIPGRLAFAAAPDDWPETLHPGSLNVKIAEDGYPVQLLNRCPGTLVEKLDSRMFAPAFEIPRDAIENNGLKPKRNKPRRGDAQVWRALLAFPTHARPVECWVLRRFCSTIKRQLEIVSDKHLRKEFGLVDGVQVAVKLHGMWHTE
jgi:CTP-dependent riboflavin kinase